MVRIVRSAGLVLRAAAAALAALGAARSQAPSAFSEFAPPGGVDPAKLVVTPVVGGPGMLAVYRDGPQLSVYSTVLGRWYSFALSFGTTPVLLAEVLLVPESDRWTAFSARRGVFVPLFVDYATSTLVEGSTLAVVASGGDRHVFSAFTGVWHSRQVPAAWTSRLGERLATFQPPGVASGFQGLVLFDAVAGTWHDLVAPATDTVLSTRLTASTALVLLRRPDNTTWLASYSTHRQGWQHHLVASTPPLFNQGGGGALGSDFANVRDVCYSGLTDTLAVLGDDVAPAIAGLVAHAYDTTTGAHHVRGIADAQWTSLPAGAAAALAPSVPVAVRIFGQGGQAIAFSALTGTLAAVPNTYQFYPAAHQGMTVAGVVDWNSGERRVYSAVTAQWAPPVPDSSASPWGTSPNAILLPTTGGFVAFSGRTGDLVPLSGAGLALRGALVVSDATTLFAFDGQTGRWLSTPVQAAGLSNAPFATTADAVVFVDGVRAIGYGVRRPHLAAVTLPEPALQQVVLAGGGLVRTSGRLLGFSGLPEVLPLHGFPDDGHAVGPGTTFRHQLRLAPGNVALLCAGPRLPWAVPLPPLGELWIDPAGWTLEWVVSPPGEERVERVIPVPDAAVLRGTEWGLQALVLTPAGGSWLSDVATVRLL